MHPIHGLPFGLFVFRTFRTLLTGLGLLCPVTAISGSAADPPLPTSTVCISAHGPKGWIGSSGFFLPPGDRILTTAHGIKGSSRIQVRLRDGRLFPALVERIGKGEQDFAVIRIGERAGTPVPIGSAKSLAQGDEVTTVGCPEGFDFTTSRGIVSALRDKGLGAPLIQTDVAVNPGSSGGPLFDRNGRVVGVIKSAAIDRDRINIALPIDLAVAMIDAGERERSAYDKFNQAVLETDPARKSDLYTQVILIAPGFPAAHHNRALALEKLGRTAEAEAEYRAALRIRPGAPEATINLAALLYGQAKFQEAIEIAREGLSTNPRSLALRNNLAESLRAHGDTRGAQQQFEMILAQDDQHAPAHFGLALLLAGPLKDPPGAIRHFERYLQLAPSAPDAEAVRERIRALKTSAGGSS